MEGGLLDFASCCNRVKQCKLITVRHRKECDFFIICFSIVCIESPEHGDDRQGSIASV